MKYLQEFEFLLTKQNPDILNVLQHAKPVEVVKDALQAIGVHNKDLITLYSWRDGINKKDFSEKTIEELEIFPGIIMPSLDNAVSYYSMYALESAAWDKSLFPIFTDGGGDFLLLNTNSNDQRHGMIYLYSPSLLLSKFPMTIYDSLEHLFLTMSKCLMEGIYTSGSYGSLEVDYDIKYKVSEEINVRSDYWKNNN